MVRFEEDFEVTLQITEQEFSAYLLSIVDSDLDELSEQLASTNKPFRGHIKFNRFTLIPTQTFFKKASGQIKGEFKSENGKLLVKGRVVSNKFLLTFLVGFTILCFCMLINSLISAPNEEITMAAIGVFFLIGVSNLIRVNKSLKNQRTDFLDRLVLAEKDRIPKS
ncbi:hypothetical protein [Pontibacter anaerobius]|uniref:Uncharacterized protein n=1 Tax=Pontibacter anaerobius TaxID=2993940 RepID=A0ABT3RC17_9BACT|nr:hypothetical protein [Pontibacter anaerobius]MCX2739418.1 hypothetical protein [Pontibacter anaerobius]